MSNADLKPMSRVRDDHFDLSKADLRELIKKEKFFHDMEISDGTRTGSWVYGEELPPNYHLWPLFRYLSEMNLKGSTCIDVGTYDGMTAFALAKLGAARVDATCQYDLSRFRLIRAYERLESVAYFPKTDLTQIVAEFTQNSYDLVVISAMLHHLTSPLDALLLARRLLKPGGLLLLESIAFDGDAPTLTLNTEIEQPIYGAPTLFVPTARAIDGMLRLASFEPISRTQLLGGKAARETSYERFTFLARAEKPSNVRRTEKTKEIHTNSPKVGCIDYSVLESDLSAPSTISYSGEADHRALNIWTHRPTLPLQPRTFNRAPKLDLAFSVGREKDFIARAARRPLDAFTSEDIYLLAAKYPGEAMPEGMRWSIKQFGNLFILEAIERLGLQKILEVGPGLNYYFPRHLPHWRRYFALDSAGFYEDEILRLANSRRPGEGTFDSLLGESAGVVDDASFDACISASVLEHVPPTDIESVANDMHRLLRVGGWALHSIDLPTSELNNLGRRWLDAFRSAGFEVDISGVDQRFGGARKNDESDPVFVEPLSIRARFYGGYKPSIWGLKAKVTGTIEMATILVAARKKADDVSAG